MVSLLWISIVLTLGGCIWEAVDSAKISCKSCKKFEESFKKRLDATANSNYAGGDTSWEEENLGSYSDSEVRLVEILDVICKTSDYECLTLLEEVEEDLEKWWFKLRKSKENANLLNWLCFSHLNVCCPENSFGPACELCPGAPNNTCGGRGKCEGVEERNGKGTCSCDAGYTGVMCQSCDTKYYQEVTVDDDDDNDDNDDKDEESVEDLSKLECKACDRACADSCDGPGPGECHSCADGYRENDEEVCEDIDECKIDGDTRCKNGTYCTNIPGSFQCYDCDKACLSICNGPGPAKCAECAKGYTRSEVGVCKDDDECTSGEAECREGTYCENTPGKYVCKACHVACLTGCHGAGAKSCIACKEGYTMNDDGCSDVDECKEEPGPCDSETEVCTNMVGTYLCKCLDDLVKGADGKCITEEEHERQQELKKAKKKKRRKKKRKSEEESKEAEPGQPVYPWYHMVGPLGITLFMYKYWRPNLITSVADKPRRLPEGDEEEGERKPEEVKEDMRGREEIRGVEEVTVREEETRKEEVKEEIKEEEVKEEARGEEPGSSIGDQVEGANVSKEQVMEGAKVHKEEGGAKVEGIEEPVATLPDSESESHDEL